MLNAYSQETAAAGEFEGMIVVDSANSRTKGSYDLPAMSRLFVFEGRTLAAAISATFEKHLTAALWEHSPTLTDAFSGDSSNVEQWLSFLACEPLLIDQVDLPRTFPGIGAFIMQAAHGAIDYRKTLRRWSVEGGWRPAT